MANKQQEESYEALKRMNDIIENKPLFLSKRNILELRKDRSRDYVRALDEYIKSNPDRLYSSVGSFVLDIPDIDRTNVDRATVEKILKEDGGWSEVTWSFSQRDGDSIIFKP